jgi:hypothetical protein
MKEDSTDPSPWFEQGYSGVLGWMGYSLSEDGQAVVDEMMVMLVVAALVIIALAEVVKTLGMLQYLEVLSAETVAADSLMGNEEKETASLIVPPAPLLVVGEMSAARQAQVE